MNEIEWVTHYYRLCFEFRAAQSQLVVEAMKTKCENMKDKLDYSKQTLKEATIRAETKDKVKVWKAKFVLYPLIKCLNSTRSFFEDYDFKFQISSLALKAFSCVFTLIFSGMWNNQKLKRKSRRAFRQTPTSTERKIKNGCCYQISGWKWNSNRFFKLVNFLLYNLE